VEGPLILQILPPTEIVIVWDKNIRTVRVKFLLYKGHILWMDTDCNSPGLAKFLNLCNTDCVQIIKINRKNVPHKVKEKSYSVQCQVTMVMRTL
jgi:hypothetical protein